MFSRKESFPKEYTVPFVPKGEVEDALIACYSLLNAPVFRPEITIVSGKASSFKDLLRYSVNPVVLTVSKTEPSTFENFRESYMKHRAGVTAVAALDKKDKLRININLPDEKIAEKYKHPLTLTMIVYDEKTDAQIPDFFAGWQECFDSLKAGLASEK